MGASNTRLRMTASDGRQDALELTNKVLRVTSGLDLPRGYWWPSVVIVSLSQSNERLDSIRILLDKDYMNSAIILTRSLFELAATSVYIARDVENRLPAYLEHGGVPLSERAIEVLQAQLTQELQTGRISVGPTKPWKQLKEVCTDLGPPWPDEYKTFYPYASWPTHAGSSLVGKDFLRLLERQMPSIIGRATVLITAVTFHVRFASVAAEVFPKQISPQTVAELASECQSFWGRA